MSVLIRELTMADYDQVMSLWSTCEGIGLSSADTPHAIRTYLDRNPHLSWVAEEAGQVWRRSLCVTTAGAATCITSRCDCPPKARHRPEAGGKVSGGVADRWSPEMPHLRFQGQSPGCGLWTHLGWTPRADIGVVSIDLCIS
jgi:putative acetyltransferase